MTVDEFIRRSRPCREGLPWLRLQPDMRTMYETCPKFLWLMWLLFAMSEIDSAFAFLLANRLTDLNRIDRAWRLADYCNGSNEALERHYCDQVRMLLPWSDIGELHWSKETGS